MLDDFWSYFKYTLLTMDFAGLTGTNLFNVLKKKLELPIKYYHF